MKKILLTLCLLVVSVIAAKALTATVYVEAEEAPYLYGWFTVSGRENKINGAWPGKQLTESVEKTDSKGVKHTFWFQAIEISASSFNIIFNNGLEGVNKKQTSNISNISSDRYFTYDGADKYTDITDDFGVEVPDVEIQSIALLSDLNEWDGMAQLFTEVEKNKKYTFNVVFTDEQLEEMEEYYRFKLMINSSAYLGYENIDKGVTLDDPNEWIEQDLAEGGGTNFGIDLSEEGANVKALLFTVTFAGGKDIYQGWTLRVEAGDPNGSTAKKGDINGDGVVNGMDIQAIINACVDELTDAKYDVNGDGTINGQDIQTVINIAAEAARRMGLTLE